MTMERVFMLVLGVFLIFMGGFEIGRTHRLGVRLMGLGAAIVGGLLTTIGWLLVKGQDILINQIYWYLFALLVLAGVLLLTGWLKIRKQA